MSIEQNKAITQRMLEEVVNGRKLELANELLAPDYQHHDPNLPPQMQTGRDNYMQVFPLFFTAFPDLQGALEDLIAEGDRVVARLTFQGTHQGELMGIPASGRPVNFSMIQIHRIADGRIAEGWIIFDALTMMQQIGAVPAPPAP